MSTPTKKSIDSALTNYNFVIKVLERIISNIEAQNENENRWFVYSEKIARKYLNQAYTFNQLIQDDIFFVKNNIEVRFIDFSSLFALLRIQLESYSVFYHLFADKCDMEEKIIRFRLWELDGLRTIENYTEPNFTENTTNLSKNKSDIENCISVINDYSFFQNLEKKTQETLVKYTNWKFTSESLGKNDKRKWKLSNSQLILRTGLKKSLYNDWYSYASTHIHSTYWSVVQNDSLSTEEKAMMEYVAIMQGVFTTSFFIKDLCEIYGIAREVFDSLDEHERNVINSYNVGGRDL